MADERAVEVVITGHVQGVLFRVRAREQAEGRGVSGWITNQPDGSVAAHFEGPGPGVDALVDWCHTGPERARVAGVEVTATDPTGATGFDVRDWTDPGQA